MLSKKKGISTLIAVILLIVVAVILVTIILSFSTDFTTKSLNKTDTKQMSKSSAENFIYPKSFKDGVLQFNFSPVSSSEPVVIISYKVFTTGAESEEISLSNEYTLHEGLNIVQLTDFSDLEIIAKKISIQFSTNNNEYILLKNIINSSPFQETDCISGLNEYGDYIICYADDFDYVRENLAGSYILGRNIDFFDPEDWNSPPEDIDTTTDNWNSGEGFEPIGNNSTKFTGTFEGNNKKLRHLYINRPATDNVGLFGYIDTATISNLGLKDVNVIGSNYVGGLVGYILGCNTRIYNNYVIGSVFGINNVGGFAGRIDQGTLSNNYSSGTVVGGDNVGGFFGERNGGNVLSSSYSTSSVTGNNSVGGFGGNSWGKFNNCYSTGDVLGNDYVGGFVGNGGGKINNCYSTSNVVGNDNVGGFVGNGDSKYFNNYSTGDVLGNNNVGGFVGIVDGYGYIYNNYTTSNVSGNNNVGGFVGSATTNKIINNYSWGDVTRISGSSENYFGGFAGYRDDSGHSGQMANNYSIGKVIYEGTDNPTDKGFMGYSDGGCLGDGNNYWDMNTSLQTSSFGDAEGKTTDELTYPYDVFTFPSWDFPSVWRIDTTNVNNGYPYLYWQDIGTSADTQISTSFCSEDVNIDSQGRYIIDNAVKLDCVRNRLSGNFILGADINLEGIEFEPIGGLGTDSANAFRGTFDGNNHTISNLYINLPDSEQVGLFGYTLNATIINLKLEDVNIIGKDTVGGLVGLLKYSTFSNNSSTGNVIGINNYVGGLVGQSYNSLISNSHSTASVNSSELNCGGIGGLVGSCSGTIITDCYSTGNVTGNQKVGGLIGELGGGAIYNSYSTGDVNSYWISGGLVGSSSGLITNSYSLGDVNGAQYIGGLVGASYNLITNCYSIGTVSGGVDSFGGLVGLNTSEVNYSFYDLVNSGQSDNTGKGTPTIISKMLNQSTFINWNFSEIWNIDENTSYPYLISNTQIPHPLPQLYIDIYPENTYFNTSTNITFLSNGDTIYYTTDESDPNCVDVGTLYSNPIPITEDTTIKAITCKDEQSISAQTKYYVFDGSGSGTEEDPYILFTQRDLNVVLRNNLSSYFKLGQDIDMNVSPYNEGEGWEPIGDNSYPFNGYFDGNDYTISNLYINRPTTYYVGLFGFTNNNAAISNIGLLDVNIIGRDYVGGLIGYGEYTNFENCFSTGKITGRNKIGGLIGYSFVNTINNSYSKVDINGSGGDIGGLVGSTYPSTITNCYATGNVSGTLNIGGFAGGIFQGTTSNNYSLGNVYRVSGTDTLNFGGFCGSNNQSPITNCYSKGRVYGNNNWNPVNKGFVGFIYTGGPYADTNNFYDTNTSLQTSTAGNALGKTTTEMKTQSTFTGWNFTTDWNITEGTTYPYLRNNIQSPLPE